MVVCIWGSFKQHSKETGPHPSPRLTNCSWSFSYFSCNKPLCESTRDVLEKQTQEPVNELYSKLKTCPDNPAYSCVFEPPNSKVFEKSSLTPPLGLRILPLFEDSKIDLDVVMTPQCQIPVLGVNLNLRSVCLWQNMKKIPQTLKCINKPFWK